MRDLKFNRVSLSNWIIILYKLKRPKGHKTLKRQAKNPNILKVYYFWASDLCLDEHTWKSQILYTCFWVFWDLRPKRPKRPIRPKRPKRPKRLKRLKTGRSWGWGVECWLKNINFYVLVNKRYFRLFLKISNISDLFPKTPITYHLKKWLCSKSQFKLYFLGWISRSPWSHYDPSPPQLHVTIFPLYPLFPRYRLF